MTENKTENKIIREKNKALLLCPENEWDFSVLVKNLISQMEWGILFSNI